MRKLILYIIALMSATLTLSSSKNDSPSSDDEQQKVQAAVDSVRLALSKKLGIDYPYINVLIQTPTEKIFVSSAAAGKQPLTADTYFRFASNTKNFTAAAILNMYEDGWLDYKAKITDTIPGSNITYVPSTPEWNFPYKNDITVEQLMQHSAGVFDVDNDSVPGYHGTYTDYMLELDSMHRFITDEMVNVLTKKNLSYFAPGHGYHYSNTGYAILAKIISRVYSSRAGTDKTYQNYMEDSIVGSGSPVPIPEIHFPVEATDNALPDPHVAGAFLLPGGNMQRFDKFNMSAQIGEGNGYGTMDALNTYIRSLMRGENTLKPSTVQLMQTDRTPYDTGYGLGCRYDINLGYGHNGARIGYLSKMTYDPVHDVSVVSMVTLWDLQKGNASLLLCLNSIVDAAYAARSALGYPGKP
jgi:D-alanyl-D-alanine carboxypeptidase